MFRVFSGGGVYEAGGIWRVIDKISVSAKGRNFVVYAPHAGELHRLRCEIESAALAGENCLTLRKEQKEILEKVNKLLDEEMESIGAWLTEKDIVRIEWRL